MFAPDAELKGDRELVDTEIAHLLRDAPHYEMRINIGDIVMRMRVAEKRLIDDLKARYEPFFAADWGRKPDITLSAAQVPRWDVDGSEKHHLLNISLSRGCHYAFRWDFGCRFQVSGDAVIGWMAHTRMAHYTTIDSFIRMGYSFSSVLRGGFLLHSASMVSGEKGYLFCGPSRAGKSTASEVSRKKVKVLTDEVSIALPLNGGWSVYGTPFWGQMQVGLPESAPLEGIHFLNQAHRVQRNAIGVRDSVRRLMRNVLFFGRSRMLCDRVFSNCINLARSVPAYELDFLPDDSFWRCIDEAEKQNCATKL